MKTTSKMMTAMAAVAAFAPLAPADTIELTGIVRDFNVDHPDFEAYPGTSDKNMVEDQLGEDGKPVLNMSWYEWRHGTDKQAVYSEESFNQWFRDVPDVNISIPLTITLDNGQDEPGGVYSFAREKQMPEPYKYFFPIDNQGYGLTYSMPGHELRWAAGGVHNFHFTYELETEFTYTDPDERDEAMVFAFTGDDDVWVFINGRLAVDIGGVHGQMSDSVNLDEEAEALGLKPGGTYQLKLFFAERHTSESNFRIETTLTLKAVEPTTISPTYD